MPATAKRPVGELEVGLGRLEQMRGDPLALRDDFVRRDHERAAADRRGPRAERADAERHLVGVALDVADVLRLEPEARMRDLLEHRLVTLPLALGAEQHGRGPARIEPDFGVLETRPRGALDRVGKPEPEEAAALRRRFAPRAEAGVVGGGERLGHVRGVIAGVVDPAERVLVRHCRGRNQVPAPQLRRVMPQFARGIVDETLDHVRRLGAPVAAVGRRRARVGQGAEHVRMRDRDRVHAGERADVAEGTEQVALRGDVGADVRRRPHAQAEELAVRVERELGLADPVARMLVGENRLAPLARPLHRPAELLRRPQDEAVLHVGPALRAEAAADVAGDDADRGLGDAEDVDREHVAHPVRVLEVGIERVAILARVVIAERPARFDELRVHAGDDVAPPYDMRRAREGGIGRRPVAHLEHVGDVVGAFVPDGRAAGVGCRGRRGDRGQRIVVDRDQFGGVLRLRGGLGDDQRDRVADVAHAAAREAGVRRREHRRAVGAFALKRHRRRAETVRGDVVAGEDRKHAGRCDRSYGIDGADRRMRVRRAQDVGVRLAGQVHVVDEASLAAEEARVLEPLDGLTDAELAHAAPCLVGCLVVG